MLSANVEFLDVMDDKIHFSSVKLDYIDKEIFKDALRDAEKLRETIEENNERTPFFEKLSEDLFNALYKVAPKVHNEENVAVSLKLENKILKRLIDNENFNKLRKNTACDLFNSTYALSMFLDKAREILENLAKQSEAHRFLMDNINTAIACQEQLMEVSQQLMYDPEDDDLKEQVCDLKKLIDKADSNILKAQKKGTEIVDIKKISDSLKDVLAEVQKKLSKDWGLMKSFVTLPKAPGDENGKLQKVSYEEKLEFAKILTKSSIIKHISKRLGKMRTYIEDINKNPGKYGLTIAGVGIGNSINRILSCEKVLLSDRDLENQFYKKYLNKTLLQYEVQGEDEINGPLIACIDNSESMKGKKEYFAKAIAISMLQIAAKAKRAYRCVLFDNTVNKVIDSKKNEYNLKKIIEIAETFYGGGTEFEPPLEKALETLSNHKFKKADILFITDGEPVKFLSMEFRKKLEALKKKRKFIIHGIIIGAANDKYMMEFCDYIIRFDDLADEKALINIFNDISSN
jgi:uncharacterized protein with von Willebrand factor type A (vWA) domain